MDELYYYAFCIGYDFMNKFFSESRLPECDVVFEECKRLAKEFMKSKDYKDTSKSGYEKLGEWLKDNEQTIKKEYIEESINGDLPYGVEIYQNGYICIVNDYNDDNINETIVEIYKTRKDLRNGKYIERVSLKNEHLEKNIKEYIKENYKPLKQEREAR